MLAHEKKNEKVPKERNDEHIGAKQSAKKALWIMIVWRERGGNSRAYAAFWKRTRSVSFMLLLAKHCYLVALRSQVRRWRTPTPFVRRRPSHDTSSTSALSVRPPPQIAHPQPFLPKLLISTPHGPQKCFDPHPLHANPASLPWPVMPEPTAVPVSEHRVWASRNWINR